MAVNPLEEKAKEYLRLNGFFTIPKFVLHFTDGQAKEIDILGVRLKGSVEQAMEKRGQFVPIVFGDDETLALGDNSKDILLIAEATESPDRGEVRKRLNYLREKTRLEYALQRFGFVSEKDIENLIGGRVTDKKLLKVMFVIKEDLKASLVDENRDIVIISWNHLSAFINNRAGIDIKQRARMLLPTYLHNEMDELLSRG